MISLEQFPCKHLSSKPTSNISHYYNTYARVCTVTQSFLTLCSPIDCTLSLFMWVLWYQPKRFLKCQKSKEKILSIGVNVIMFGLCDSSNMINIRKISLGWLEQWFYISQYINQPSTDGHLCCYLTIPLTTILRCVFLLFHKRIPPFWCDISISIVHLLIIMPLYWSNLAAALSFYHLISLHFFLSLIVFKVNHKLFFYGFFKITWKIDYISLSIIPLTLLLFYFKWSIIYILESKL